VDVNKERERGKRPPLEERKMAITKEKERSQIQG
jgi:hypothetical protein